LATVWCMVVAAVQISSVYAQRKELLPIDLHRAVSIDLVGFRCLWRSMEIHMIGGVSMSL
jgi:hypothetical protein